MDRFTVNISEAVCLGTSFALSGICYYLYRKRRKTVNKLDDAPHFSIDGKLKDVLKVTPGVCLRYAVIEGAVQPLGESLNSHFQKETVGVLQRFSLREHRLVWNSLSRTWTDSERLLHQRVNSVPFVLKGSDETAVKVMCPLQASGEQMEITHEKFYQVNYGLGDIVGQFLSGEKLKGQLETEEMLKVGTNLTGIGELVLDTDGTLKLQPPSNGSQYFLSIVDFDTLRGGEESTAVKWKMLTIVLALAGGAVLIWLGRRYYQHRRLRWEQEQERREFESVQTAARGLGDPLVESDDHIENTCLICLSQPRNCIILDCGHICCCYRCYQALTQQLCPICRQSIIRVLPLYRA